MHTWLETFLRLLNLLFILVIKISGFEFEKRLIMITNKRSQELLILATTGKALNKNATEKEKKFYEEWKHDYKVMHETDKKWH